MRFRISVCSACLLVLGPLCIPRATAQGGAEIYQIKENVFRSHVEYHGVKIAKGGEVTLADLTGPGKVTYWYITDDKNGQWYPGLGT